MEIFILELSVGAHPVRASLFRQEGSWHQGVFGFKRKPYRALRLEAFNGLILAAAWTEDFLI
jgi:hypothetical protein